MKKKLITAILGVGITLGTTATSANSVSVDKSRAQCIAEYRQCILYLPRNICGTDFKECMGLL